jgi:hypothetical protein
MEYLELVRRIIHFLMSNIPY